MCFLGVLVGELSRLLEEKETALNLMNRSKAASSTQIQELKRLLDEEIKVCHTVVQLCFILSGLNQSNGISMVKIEKVMHLVMERIKPESQGITAYIKLNGVAYCNMESVWRRYTSVLFVYFFSGKKCPGTQLPVFPPRL